ncbi:MAG: DNA repair protein RecN [Lachnospiraceae bacterium]|nr:DNA repair protein RecN [Lachnospiraceae bacterium]
MLYELHVKDMALIREASLEFGEGFHVLTGETGAGKSLLLGSVELALGAKASPDLVRAGAESALSELVFSVSDPEMAEALSELEICPDEDGALILSRRISEKRGACRINGETVPASKLREAASLLIDIHGQHEHQSLLKKSNHIRILDEYAGEKLGDLKKDLARAWQAYRDAEKELSENQRDESALARELSLIKHELSEIRSAALKEGEDDELEKSYALLSNSQKILEGVGGAAGELTSGDGAGDRIGRAVSRLSAVSSYDPALEQISDTLLQAEELVNDAARQLSDYVSENEFDEKALYETETRLDLVNSLKQRYGRSLEDIENYALGLEKKLAELEDYDTYMDSLKKSLVEKEETLKSLCEKVSLIRKEEAAFLKERMERELSDLNFLDARFEVHIEDLGEYTRQGRDDVEFLISMNPGEPMRPLSKVASGGELSRIMLALRSVSAVRDGIDTLIFDEIDAGISGVTADRVAKKLALLSKDRQVICITHLPQIAAYADRHYRIEKTAEDQVTTTSIKALDTEERVEELVRLLGGTGSAHETAKELLRLANKSC